MKAGDAVTYVVSDGVHEGTVVAVVGSGPSGYKRLDIKAKGDVWQDVPHERDMQLGGFGYWTLGPVPAPEVVPESSTQDSESEADEE